VSPRPAGPPSPAIPGPGLIPGPPPIPPGVDGRAAQPG
jgi:hypothetical protein